MVDYRIVKLHLVSRIVYCRPLFYHLHLLILNSHRSISLIHCLIYSLHFIITLSFIEFWSVMLTFDSTGIVSVLLLRVIHGLRLNL